MSLRAKLLLLWGGLAVAPLLAIGVFEYFHSIRSLHALIASQAAAISERAAVEVADRYALRISDLLLMAENAETQRFFEAYAAGNGADLAQAREAAESYLDQAWELFGSSYLWIELRDSADVSLLRFGGLPGPSPDESRVGPAGLRRSTLLVQPVLDSGGGRELGRVVARVPLDRILPQEHLEVTFGRAGYSTVIDRATDRVLFHPQERVEGGMASALLGPSGWGMNADLFQQERGNFSFQDSDSTRVASFTTLTLPPWTMIATGAVDEFSPAITGMRVGKLLLVLLVAGVASAAFVLVVRKGTRSLFALSLAADQVGDGNFAPRLPEPSQDEVGRLTKAFGLMVGRVEDMVRQIEAGRHMAVVGEFASQISHEVRNPLTTLKLNLQTLQRAVDQGQIPEDQEPAVETCLQEIQRLDRVVKGVLALGRSHSTTHAPCSIHEVLDSALRVAQPQGRQKNVQIDVELRAEKDRISGDAEQLEAALLNLLLNGLDAADGEGGQVRIVTENTAGDRIVIQISDNGPGVGPEARDLVFRPFYSSKSAGSGFGLPLALRTFEEHKGHLVLEEDAAPLGGAAFRVDLPLLPEDDGE